MNMKHKGLFLILFICLLASNKLFAQETISTQLFEEITDVEKLVRQNAVIENDKETNGIAVTHDTISPQTHDTIFVTDNLPSGIVPLDSMYYRNEYGILQLPDRPIRQLADWVTLRDTVIVDPLFLPIVFTGGLVPDDLSFYPPKKDYKYKGALIPEEKTFAKRLDHNEFMRKVRLDYYSNNLDKVKFTYLDFDDEPMIGTDKDVIETFNPFKELISTETSFSLEAPKVDGVKLRRIYWTTNGDHSLHFTQNYFSPNWHKGGTSNFNIINRHTLRFNYRKNKVRFNNTLEMRVALMTAPDDTLRNYRISDDVLRYVADFGVDAFGKHWSYSTNVDARSQFFNNHPVNSNEIQSAFLAPLYVNLGVGLKYNLDKKSEKVRHRRVRLSFNFDPASLSLKYVNHKDVDVKRYGIEEGKKHVLDVGSTVTGNLIYNFNKYIELNTRFKYFTSYHKVEAELENTLNMALTNTLSTSLYVNLRYDDGVPADEKYKYLQVNELLSVGLNYKW